MSLSKEQNKCTKIKAGWGPRGGGKPMRKLSVGTFSKWPAATADPERTWLARLSQKAGCALLKPLSLTICPRCTALPARCTRKEAVLPVSDRPQSLVNQSKPAIFEIADTTWSQRAPIQSELVGTYWGGHCYTPIPALLFLDGKEGSSVRIVKSTNVLKFVTNWLLFQSTFTTGLLLFSRDYRN